MRTDRHGRARSLRRGVGRCFSPTPPTLPGYSTQGRRVRARGGCRRRPERLQMGAACPGVSPPSLNAQASRWACYPVQALGGWPGRARGLGPLGPLPIPCLALSIPCRPLPIPATPPPAVPASPPPAAHIPFMRTDRPRRTPATEWHQGRRWLPTAHGTPCLPPSMLTTQHRTCNTHPRQC